MLRGNRQAVGSVAVTTEGLQANVVTKKADGAVAESDMKTARMTTAKDEPFT